MPVGGQGTRIEAGGRSPTRKVLVIGSGGAGKTTLARRMAEITGLPLVELDASYWRPGWVPAPEDEWRRRVAELVAGDAWIMDGNYGRTLETRLAACDTAVFLDFPRLRCVARVLGRQWRHFGRERAGLPAGCPERLSPSFLWWIWRYPSRSRPNVMRLLAAAGDRVRTVVLRDDREIAEFLDRLRAAE